MRNKLLLSIVILCGIISGVVFANEDILAKLLNTFGTNANSPQPTIVKAVGTIEVAMVLQLPWSKLLLRHNIRY